LFMIQEVDRWVRDMKVTNCGILFSWL
jgi:hypothetical protein